MASCNELESLSPRGKLRGRVFAALLLALSVVAAPTMGWARPAYQAARPRFQNNPQAHLGPWLQRHGTLPPAQQEQRAVMMNSGRFQAQFTPQERGILGNILAVEPYQPVRGSSLDNGLESGR
jgi:hypothetical protein